MNRLTALTKKESKMGFRPIALSGFKAFVYSSHAVRAIALTKKESKMGFRPIALTA